MELSNSGFGCYKAFTWDRLTIWLYFSVYTVCVYIYIYFRKTFSQREKNMLWKINYADNVPLCAHNKKYKGHVFPQGCTSEMRGRSKTKQNKKIKRRRKRIKSKLQPVLADFAWRWNKTEWAKKLYQGLFLLTKVLNNGRVSFRGHHSNSLGQSLDPGDIYATLCWARERVTGECEKNQCRK